MTCDLCGVHASQRDVIALAVGPASGQTCIPCYSRARRRLGDAADEKCRHLLAPERSYEGRSLPDVVTVPTPSLLVLLRAAAKRTRELEDIASQLGQPRDAYYDDQTAAANEIARAVGEQAP